MMNRRSSRFWLMLYCLLGAFLCGLGLSRGSGSITLTEGMVAEAGENMWKTGRAFRTPAEVPPGALYLFAERPSGLDPFAEQKPKAGLDLEVLTEIDHPRYSYTLARVR